MSDASGGHLDIISSADGDSTVSPGSYVEPAGPAATPADATAAHTDAAANAARPWVGILFECCAAYARVYRDPDVPYYSGRCPQCGRQVTLRVGPDGVSSRLFRAVPK